MALSDALNAELHALADAGCPVIQMEEPQIHMVPARGKAFERLDAQPTLAALNAVDADALTFETCSSGPGDLQTIGQVIKDKKIVIGVIDRHTLQVERPDEVASLIRQALKHIPPERLVISSDCGMSREGMSRRHAAYKMVAMVLGTNIVRKELGLPEVPCLAADPRYSLTLISQT